MYVYTYIYIYIYMIAWRCLGHFDAHVRSLGVAYAMFRTRARSTCMFGSSRWGIVGDNPLLRRAQRADYNMLCYVYIYDIYIYIYTHIMYICRYTTTTTTTTTTTCLETCPSLRWGPSQLKRQDSKAGIIRYIYIYIYIYTYIC